MDSCGFQDQQFGSVESNDAALFIEGDGAGAAESRVIARERHAPFPIRGRAAFPGGESSPRCPPSRSQSVSQSSPFALERRARMPSRSLKTRNILTIRRAEGGVFAPEAQRFPVRAAGSLHGRLLRFHPIAVWIPRMSQPLAAPGFSPRSTSCQKPESGGVRRCALSRPTARVRRGDQ